MSIVTKPLVALVIGDQEKNSNIKSLDFDALECRVDLFKSHDLAYVLSQIKERRRLKKSLLLTVRNKKEDGGLKTFDDQAKWAIIEGALSYVDKIDIELNSPLLKQTIALAHRLRKKVIVSTHDFKSMPSKELLEDYLRKSKAAGADFIKIAAFALTHEDMWRLIDFTRRNRDMNVITMAMGPCGKLSRLILPSAGSVLTYTFYGSAKAPGQIDVKTLNAHLKFYYS